MRCRVALFTVSRSVTLTSIVKANLSILKLLNICVFCVFFKNDIYLSLSTENLEERVPSRSLPYLSYFEIKVKSFNRSFKNIFVSSSC